MFLEIMRYEGGLCEQKLNRFMCSVDYNMKCKSHSDKNNLLPYNIAIDLERTSLNWSPGKLRSLKQSSGIKTLSGLTEVVCNCRRTFPTCFKMTGSRANQPGTVFG